MYEVDSGKEPCAVDCIYHAPPSNEQATLAYEIEMCSWLVAAGARTDVTASRDATAQERS